jgi:hypothetical protein
MRLPLMAIMATPIVFYDEEGDQSIVKGVYLQESGDSDTRPGYPQNIVLFDCFAGNCYESYAFVYDGGGNGVLNVTHSVYEIKYKDTHSLNAVKRYRDGETQVLFVDFDTQQARVEFHVGKSSYAWKIVGAEYAMTHDPRLSYLCHKHYSSLGCTQK